MKVLILEAPTGSRLWPLTRNTPKSLLDLGRGLTLLEALRLCEDRIGPHLLLLKVGIGSMKGVHRVSHAPTEIRDRFREQIMAVARTRR